MTNFFRGCRNRFAMGNDVVGQTDFLSPFLHIFIRRKRYAIKKNMKMSFRSKKNLAKTIVHEIHTKMEIIPLTNKVKACA